MEYLIQRYLHNKITLQQLKEYLNLNVIQQQYLLTEHSNYTTGEYKNVELNELVKKICKFLNNIK